MPTTSELPASPGAEAILSAQRPDSRPDETGSLDWDGFRAQSFPGRRPRHDFQAVEAYGIYRRTGVSDVGQALAFEENASPSTESQRGEIVQTEERLAQEDSENDKDTERFADEAGQ